MPALDDGSRPLISTSEITELQNFLEISFDAANIEWSVETQIIKSDQIRSSWIAVDCRPDTIGKSSLVICLFTKNTLFFIPISDIRIYHIHRHIVTLICL